MSASQRHLAAGSKQEQRTHFSPEKCFDLLGNPRRRYAIQYLRKHQKEVTLGELSDQVAAWETGQSVEDVSSEARKRVYTSFQQIHLPQMDRLNVITYDDENKVIKLGPAAEKIDVYLERVREPDIAWPRLYIALACVHAVILMLIGLDVPVLTTVPNFGWTAIVVVSFLATAFFHNYRRTMREVASLSPPSNKE